jgi:hypothetical protein
MGRPLNKKWFNLAGTHLPIRANVGTGEFEGYILKQRSNHKFKASRLDDSERGIVRLVNKTTGLLSSEGSLVGIVVGIGPLPIKKITSHIAYDFSGNKFAWELQNDSTATILILTAI